MSHRKKRVLVDFDGVLSTHESGWHGPRRIVDPPVPGALEWLCRMVQDERFEVCIYSARSGCWGGRRAIKTWLRKHYTDLAMPDCALCPTWLYDWISQAAFADPWEDEVAWAIYRLLRQIKFPARKIPAHLMIDDRAVCFAGAFPGADEIDAFTPWYKQQRKGDDMQ